MNQIKRVVLDTNVVVSAIVFPGSVPANAILKARTGVILASEAMRRELIEVLERVRFDRYAARDMRQRAAAEFIRGTIEVLISNPIRACRDPRDDKFLEAAIHGRADAIITGDLDLLALDPFHGVRILTPAAYLELDCPELD
jgi:putative PIN family toxin of toxin-antitoxin system